MQLFAGADADAVNLAIRRHGLSHIQQLHAGNFRHEDFSALHLLNATDHKFHALIQCDPEANHSRIGDCDSPSGTLLPEDGNHSAAAADDVTVAHATETRLLSASIRIRLHEHFLGTQLGCAVKIYRVYGFVGA